MAGGQDPGAELARGLQQVAEFDRLIAFEARHRRLAGHVAFREAIDHRFLEAALIIEHVMRNADALGDHAGVVNITAGATGALAVDGGAVVVEL